MQFLIQLILVLNLRVLTSLQKLQNFIAIVKLSSPLAIRFGNFDSCHEGTWSSAKEDLVILLSATTHTGSTKDGSGIGSNIQPNSPNDESHFGKEIAFNIYGNP